MNMENSNIALLVRLIAYKNLIDYLGFQFGILPTKKEQDKIIKLIEATGECEHTSGERIGETKLWCCNICGKKQRNFKK